MSAPAVDPFRPHLVECRKLIEAAQSQKAVGGIQAVLDVKPDHPDANYLMGVAQLHLGDTEKAVDLLERSNGVRPNVPIVMNELARACEMTQDHDRALAVMDQLLALNPGRDLQIDILTRRGVALARLKRFEEAEEQFRSVTRETPNYAPAWHNLGNVLNSLEDREGAVLAFREAVSLTPDSAFTLYTLGRALLWTDQYAESVELLTKAVALRLMSFR